MEPKNRIKLTLAIAICSSIFAPHSVMAWGPERATFTNEKPADYAVFNSITNNAAVGDERDFVRIVEKGTGGEYTSNINVEPGKSYEVYIYYHNNAASNLNSKDKNRVGVAWDTTLASEFPAAIKAGEKGVVSARITSSNTNPKSVWDEAYLNASKDVYLTYEAASAKIYNGWAANGSILSTSLFTDNGTFLGMDELNGMIYGCAEYSGHVLYTLVATGDQESADVVTADDTPDSIPETGPAEIALASVVIIAMIAGGMYWHKTNKAVKKVTRRVTTGRRATTNRKNTKRRK